MSPIAREDTSDEEAVLKTALADTIDGVEEEDISDSTCTDARRRLFIEAPGRRLDGSASVAFDITIEPSAVGDDGFSPDDAVAAIHSSLSTAADSGALTSNIQDAASSSGNSNLAAVSVAAVGVASSDGTDYVAPTAEPTTSDYVIIGTLAPTTNSDYVIIIAASVGGGVALICCALVLGMFICFKAKILCFEDKAPLTAPTVPVVEMTDMTQIAMAHPIALSPQNSKMQQQWGSLRNLDLNNATVVEAVPQQQGAVAVPQQAKSPALIL